MIELGIGHVSPPRVEVRESSYTEQTIARLIHAASSGVGDGSSLGAVEVCSRWWGGGLASATVKPSNIQLKSVTPTFLDRVGRSLCRVGESLHVIVIRNGLVTLTPTASWEVRGSDDPETWRYRVTLSGPTTTRTMTLDAASVIHVRYAACPNSPWRGRSPLQLALTSTTRPRYRTSRGGWDLRRLIHSPYCVIVSNTAS